MTALRLNVGDVMVGMADYRRRIEAGELPRCDLVFTSPPFLALRSYLDGGDDWKGAEHGSETTPAEWLDTQLAVIAACGGGCVTHDPHTMFRPYAVDGDTLDLSTHQAIAWCGCGWEFRVTARDAHEQAIAAARQHRKEAT